MSSNKGSYDRRSKEKFAFNHSTIMKHHYTIMKHQYKPIEQRSPRERKTKLLDAIKGCIGQGVPFTAFAHIIMKENNSNMERM